MKFKSVPVLLATILTCGFFAEPLAAGETPRKEPRRDSGVGKAIFVPFDFYPRHRDELGLNAGQLSEMQRLADQMRESAQSLEAERRERTKALQDAMAEVSPIDSKKAMELFEAVLRVENELKALQFRNGLAMRNLLTPAQVALLQPIAAKDKAAGLASTSDGLDEKLQQLRGAIRKRAKGGEPAPEVVAKVEQIERAAREGRVNEARTQIDEMLRDLRGGDSGPSRKEKPDSPGTPDKP